MLRLAEKQQELAEEKRLQDQHDKMPRYSGYFWVLLAAYIAVSSYFFKVMNQVQPDEYMDEVFHGPQTRKYCNGTFAEWDPKITTLPGTYLLATGILRLGSAIKILPSNTEELCSIINLRTYNFVLSIVNFFLIHELNFLTQMTHKKDALHLALTTLNSALFPVLYFFGFMYYTDVTSLTFLLAMHILFLKKHYAFSSLCGAYSIFVRQTNVVWVVFHGLLKSMDIFSALIDKWITMGVNIVEEESDSTLSPGPLNMRLQGPGELKDRKRNFLFSTFVCISLFGLCDDKAKHCQMVCQSFKEEMFVKKSYFSVLWYVQATVLFLLFVIFNGGVVVGDKEAHKVTINLVQMGYYTLMFGAFTLPFLVTRLYKTLRLVGGEYRLAQFLCIIFAVIVYFNTVVHPYVLADNRHVTFYLWKRVFAKYEIVRYLLIPYYVWVWMFIWDNLDLSINYRCVLVLCCFVNFVPQLLLEFRYFIFPYILMRSSLEKPKLVELVLESAITLAINCVVFYFYVNYPFTWEGTPGYQRFMW